MNIASTTARKRNARPRPPVGRHSRTSGNGTTTTTGVGEWARTASVPGLLHSRSWARRWNFYDGWFIPFNRATLFASFLMSGFIGTSSSWHVMSNAVEHSLIGSSKVKSVIEKILRLGQPNFSFFLASWTWKLFHYRLTVKVTLASVMVQSLQIKFHRHSGLDEEIRTQRHICDGLARACWLAADRESLSRTPTRRIFLSDSCTY